MLSFSLKLGILLTELCFVHPFFVLFLGHEQGIGGLNVRLGDQLKAWS